jgi:hypothetical protein
VRVARLVPVVGFAVAFGVGLVCLGSGCDSGGKDSTSSKEEVFAAEDPRSEGRTPAEQKADLARRALGLSPAKDDLLRKPQRNPSTAPPKGR